MANGGGWIPQLDSEEMIFERLLDLIFTPILLVLACPLVLQKLLEMFQGLYRFGGKKTFVLSSAQYVLNNSSLELCFFFHFFLSTVLFWAEIARPTWNPYPASAHSNFQLLLFILSARRPPVAAHRAPSNSHRGAASIGESGAHVVGGPAGAAASLGITSSATRPPGPAASLFQQRGGTSEARRHQSIKGEQWHLETYLIMQLLQTLFEVEPCRCPIHYHVVVYRGQSRFSSCSAHVPLLNTSIPHQTIVNHLG